MTQKEQGPVKLNDSLYWLGMGGNPGFLQVNVYMIYRDGVGILIDPGPSARFEEIKKACDSITGIENIQAVVVSHQDPDICSSLPDWERAGFRGKIITHWRTGILLQSFGLVSPFQNIKDNDTGIMDQYLSLRFLSFPHLHSPGNILTFDEKTRTLFSSDLFGAIGMNTHLYADDAYVSRMVFFHENYMPSTRLLHEGMNRINDLHPLTICPQHGSIIKTEIPKYIGALQSVKCGMGMDISPSEIDDINEVSRLKKINFELQENLILNSDEQIRDPVTGLYNNHYFETFFPVFIENNKKGYVSFIRLDQMKDFNNDFGYQEGDRAIATFAKILNEEKPDDCFLLRESGPILILMQPDAYAEDPALLLNRLQRKISDSDDFIRDMTCSVAVAGVSELHQESQNPARELLTLIRSRVKILDRMGPHSISDSSVQTEDLQDRKVILLIDSDVMTAKLISEYLSARDFLPVICSDGNSAMHQIDLNRPDAIIAEISVPQLDGFRIREQLTNTSDLREIPFIYMSHQKTEATVRRAQKLGVSHYLKKPVMLAEVYAILRILTDDKNDS